MTRPATPRVTGRARSAALVLLVAAAGVNLFAGALRPFRERAILRHNEYAAASLAAAAIRQRVPANESVSIVAPDRGTAVWLWEYLQWLAYPRVFPTHEAAPAVGWPVLAPGGYVLLFSRSGPPPRAQGEMAQIAAGPTWRLARSAGR